MYFCGMIDKQYCGKISFQYCFKHLSAEVFHAFARVYASDDIKQDSPLPAGASFGVMGKNVRKQEEKLNERIGSNQQFKHQERSTFI